MKNISNRKLVIRGGIVFALALAIWSPLQAQTAEPMKGKMMMDGKMSERHEERMKEMKAMRAEMKAQDAQLTTLVSEMNSAPESKKLALLAAIVTQLVERRNAMSARMEMMQGEMGMPMMHDMPADKEAMPPPPMMNGMDNKMGETPKTQK